MSTACHYANTFDDELAREFKQIISSNKGMSEEEPFSPDQIEGLVLWLDGSDQGTLFADIEGSILAANGEGIARWNDKSTQANHAIQGVIGKRPNLVINIINGNSAVEFSQVNFTSIAGSIGETGDNLSIFTVGYFGQINQIDYDYILNLGNGSAGMNLSISRSFNGVGSASTNGLYSYDGVNARGGPVVAGGAWGLFGSTLNATSPYYTFHVNGESTNAADHSNINSTDGSYALGLWPSGNSHYFTGYIGEIIIYNNALGGGNRNLVEQYQAAKWGIALQS